MMACACCASRLGARRWLAMSITSCRDLLVAGMRRKTSSLCAERAIERKLREKAGLEKSDVYVRKTAP